MNGYHVPVQVLAKKEKKTWRRFIRFTTKQSRNNPLYELRTVLSERVLSAGCLSVILQYRCQLGRVVTDRQKDRQTDWSTTVTLAAIVRRRLIRLRVKWRRRTSGRRLWRQPARMPAHPGADATLVATIVFVAVGVYQWTPLKYACLKHCRSPIAFIMGHWRADRWARLPHGRRPRSSVLESATMSPSRGRRARMARLERPRVRGDSWS